MAPDIQITVALGVIRAVYRGVVKYDVTAEMLREVARLSSEAKTKLLLFDIRGADYRHYYVESIKHAQEAPALGIDQTFRIAFLGGRGVPMLQYIEDVSINRGFQVKVFTEEPAALAWLRSVL